MQSIELKVLNSELVRNQISLVARQAPKAVVLALNRTIENTKNEGIKNALSLYFINRSVLSSSVNIKKASEGNFEASFISKGSKLPLASFKVTSLKRGSPVQVSVKKNTGDKTLNSPYFGHVGKGIFKRVEAGAYPVHTVYSVSAPQMLGEETLLGRLERFSNDKLEQRLFHELSRLGGK